MFLWFVVWTTLLTDELTAGLGLSPAGVAGSAGRRPIPSRDAVSSSFTEPRNGRPLQSNGVRDAPNAQLSEARLANGQSSNGENSQQPSTYFMGRKIPLNVLMSPAAQAFWSANAKGKKTKPSQQRKATQSANLHHSRPRQPIRDQLHGDLHRGSIIKHPVKLKQDFGDIKHGVRRQPMGHHPNHGNLSHGPLIQSVEHQPNHRNVHFGSSIQNVDHQPNHRNIHHDALTQQNAKQQQRMLRVSETIMETRKSHNHGSPSANFFDVSNFPTNYYPHPPTNHQSTHHQNQYFPGHDVDARFSFKRQLRKLEYIRKHKVELAKSMSQHGNVSHTAKPRIEDKKWLTSDAKAAIAEYFKRKKQNLVTNRRNNMSLNNIKKQPRVPLPRQSIRNNIGVTKSPILTATMLGQDMKNTTDIPEELEINGVSYDSPHDMNGKPHPLSPGYNNQAGPPAPPPPPKPNQPNTLNTVTKRPILTATMLGQDMKNTTDIPEEIEINGTSYDSPHDMNGKPHPLVPGSGFYAQQQTGPVNPVEEAEGRSNVRVRFAPTTPPPYFSDLPGMTTVDFFGNSKSSIQGPPPPHHALIPAGRSVVDSTQLPTYRTVPATYAPPPPQRIYTVPATYAPEAPHPKAVHVPTTYAQPPHNNQNRHHAPTKQTYNHLPANQNVYSESAYKNNYHASVNQNNYHAPANQNSNHGPAHQIGNHAPANQIGNHAHANQISYHTSANQNSNRAPLVAAPSPAPPPPLVINQRREKSPTSDIVNGLNVALGIKSNDTIPSKFAATINEALQGKVKNAVDKALTSQVLDTLDSIISARIESLLSGGELAKSLTSSKQPTSAPVKKKTASPTSSAHSFGLTIEDKPFSKSNSHQGSSFVNSQKRPRNRVHVRYHGG